MRIPVVQLILFLLLFMVSLALVAGLIFTDPTDWEQGPRRTRPAQEARP
jgi:hypothetical protein